MPLPIQTHVFGILLPRLICHKESAKNYLLPIIFDLPFLFFVVAGQSAGRFELFCIENLFGHHREKFSVVWYLRVCAKGGRRGRGHHHPPPAELSVRMRCELFESRSKRFKSVRSGLDVTYIQIKIHLCKYIEAGSLRQCDWSDFPLGIVTVCRGALAIKLPLNGQVYLAQTQWVARTQLIMRSAFRIDLVRSIRQLVLA